MPTLDSRANNISTPTTFARARRTEKARAIHFSSAKAAGIEGFISRHSLRVGSAVSLAQSGATLVDMQTAGRWGDPKMPPHYTKAELANGGRLLGSFAVSNRIALAFGHLDIHG